MKRGLVFLLALLTLCLQGCSENGAKSAEEDNAYKASQYYVRQALSEPSLADFPEKYESTKAAGGGYTIKSYVDARNARVTSSHFSDTAKLENRG